MSAIPAEILQLIIWDREGIRIPNGVPKVMTGSVSGWNAEKIQARTVQDNANAVQIDVALDRHVFQMHPVVGFQGFLEWIRRDHPKFYMVLDNASCHKSKMIREYVESAGDDITLEFLPPYTPQLNPIETAWRDLKRRLAGRISGLLTS